MSTEVEQQKVVDQDAEDLRRLGYRQQLFREMGGFSNFAISFSIISILTGAILLFGYGLKFAGPIINAAGWPIVSLFTLCVAASMAELASVAGTSFSSREIPDAKSFCARLVCKESSQESLVRRESLQLQDRVRELTGVALARISGQLPDGPIFFQHKQHLAFRRKEYAARSVRRGRALETNSFFQFGLIPMVERRAIT